MSIKKTSHPASLASAGGAGVIVPTLQAGLTFGDTLSELTYQLQNNDADNPAALDLSFSGSVLQAVAGTFDNGDAASPSYVLEGGESRNISLERGAGAPSPGGSPTACTVSALLADGNTATSIVTVHPLSDFAGLVASISPPTYEMKFANGDFTLGGSLGGSHTVSTNNASAQTSTAIDGLDGYAQLTGTNGYAQFTAPSDTIDWRVGQARSWVLVLNQPGAATIAGYKILSNFMGAINDGWSGRIYIDPDSSRHFTVYPPNSTGTGYGAIKLEASSSHIIPSAARGAQGISKMGNGQGVKLLVFTYDGTSGNNTAVRLRYKSAGDPAGHSVLSPSGTGAQYAFTPRTGTADDTFEVFGESSTSPSGPQDLQYAYWAVIDSEVSDSDFDTLAGRLGL